MSVLKIYNQGELVAEVVDPEPVEIAKHWLAVHEHVEKPGWFQVTEPITGTFVAEGRSLKDAVDAARERIEAMMKASPGVDVVRTAIAEILGGSIGSALRSVGKYIIDNDLATTN